MTIRNWDPWRVTLRRSICGRAPLPYSIMCLAPDLASITISALVMDNTLYCMSACGNAVSTDGMATTMNHDGVGAKSGIRRRKPLPCRSRFQFGLVSRVPFFVSFRLPELSGFSARTDSPQPVYSQCTCSKSAPSHRLFNNRITLYGNVRSFKRVSHHGIYKSRSCNFAFEKKREKKYHDKHAKAGINSSTGPTARCA
jgi:hypothetical protein